MVDTAQVQARFEQALDCHRRGELEQARALYDQVLAMAPDHANALHLSGVMAAGSGDHGKAVRLIAKAIAIYPGNASFHFNLGVAYSSLNNFDAALKSFDKTVSINPDLADAYYYRGNTLLKLKRPDSAVESYDKAVSINPDFAKACYNRGMALHELKKFDEAVESYDRAIAINPDFAEACYNRGMALHELKKFDEAVESYDRAIAINPFHSKALLNRGVALKELKRFDAALESYGKAIAIKPDYHEAYSNRGVLLRELRCFDHALENFDKSISIKPDFAEALTNRGLLFKDLNQLDAALESFDKAITIRPDCAEANLNKSLVLLLRANFSSGWEYYEWRWKVGKYAASINDFDKPLWLGHQSIKGKTILLHSEQGYGDSIQFCRYAPLVADLGARVIVEAEQPIVGLLKLLPGVSAVIDKGSPRPEFDFHCPLMSLPLAFRTDLNTIPCPVTYLKSDPGKRAHWNKKIGQKSKFRVGLVWSGNAANTNDNNRSIPLSLMTKHLPEGFTYVSLQKEIRDTDKPAFESNANILHFGDELNDFTDTAALCDLMDVVICVDTGVTHLSGALGKKTWVLLPFSPDWRWMLDRDDSPWYPSLRLFRQQKPDDWDEVLARLKSALLNVYGNHEGRTLPEDRLPGNGKSAIAPLNARKDLKIKKSRQAHKMLNTAQVKARFEQALACHRLGEFEQAQLLYDEVLAMQPDHVNALHLSGVTAAQTKNYRKAAELIGKAIAIYPGNAAFHCNRGLALFELNELDPAVASFDNAVAIKPDYQEAYYHRGNALQKLMKFDEAVASYDKAIEHNPDDYEAYYRRANALQELKAFDRALESFDKAISLKPDHHKAYANRGVLLQELQQPEAALESYDNAISLKPDYYIAYANRGILLQELQRPDAALESYGKAISLKPDYPEAYFNLGNLLQELKRFEASVENYDKAIALKPDFAQACSNRGNALHELKRFDAAVESFDKAISLKPDYHTACWNKSLTLLTTGDYKNGWELYENRWNKDNFTFRKRNFPRPLWLGRESIEGKTVLLYSEQGLGDTIQFCRYVPMVADLGARVILEIKAPLAGLLDNLRGVSGIVVNGGALPDFDYHCPLMSLPLAFNTGLDTIPGPRKYLNIGPEKSAHWANRLGQKTTPRVGLVWSGRITHKQDKYRSIPLSEMTGRLPEGFTYVSLQKEVREADRSTLDLNPSILHFGDELNDFTDTAALCELMDIVISVDTSVAHLSGALGNPTWVLLPFSADWRWLLDRDDSPWYPSLRLFRQQKPDDWNGVFEKLSSALLDVYGKQYDDRQDL